MSDILYFGASVYVAVNTKDANNFAKKNGSKGYIISTKYDGKEAFIKEGKTYVFESKNPNADRAGFNWVERLNKR
jgi:hypothetical protein